MRLLENARRHVPSATTPLLFPREFVGRLSCDDRSATFKGPSFLVLNRFLGAKPRQEAVLVGPRRLPVVTLAAVCQHGPSLRSCRSKTTDKGLQKACMISCQWLTVAISVACRRIIPPQSVAFFIHFSPVGTSEPVLSTGVC
jgi:hypothetical protein